MVTEGQTATEEGGPPTTEGAAPTEPPKETPAPPAKGPSEEYKGLQRALSAAEKTIEALKGQLAAQPPVQPSTGATVQSQANDAYWQGFNAAKANGMDDQTAQAYGNYGKLYIMFQGSQQEIADLQARFQQETVAREAERAEGALVSEMRDMTRDMGLDPDDPLLDYGESGQDAAARMARLRRSIPEVRSARAAATANAPAEPVQPPDHSAERVDTSGSTSPPSGDAERKKQTFLDADVAMKGGIMPFDAKLLKRLHDDAVAAGAEF